MAHIEDPFDIEGRGEEEYYGGHHHVCMASYFEETKEMVNYEPLRVEKDPDHYAKTLQNCKVQAVLRPTWTFQGGKDRNRKGYHQYSRGTP